MTQSKQNKQNKKENTTHTQERETEAHENDIFKTKQNKNTTHRERDA